MSGNHWSIETPQTLEIDDIRSIKLAAVSGRFDVVAHDEPVARITISELEGDPLEIHADAGHLEIRHGHHDAARWLNKRHPSGPDNQFDQPNRLVITIAVPAGTDVDAGTVSGDGLVSGLAGRIRVSSVSGSVISDSTEGSLGANTVSGEAIVRNHSGDLALNSVSGELTGSGNLSGIKANSGTGDMTFDCWGPVRKISTNSVSGAVLIRLPEDLGVDLSVTSVASQITVDDENFKVLGNTKRSFGERSANSVQIGCISVSGAVSVFHRIKEAS
jgi:hypothetical protein